MKRIYKIKERQTVKLNILRIKSQNSITVKRF